jgi:hypothetical protein
MVSMSCRVDSCKQSTFVFASAKGLVKLRPDREEEAVMPQPTTTASLKTHTGHGHHSHGGAAGGQVSIYTEILIQKARSFYI